MKKFVIFALVSAMCVSLASCSGNDTTSSSSAESSAAGTESSAASDSSTASGEAKVGVYVSPSLSAESEEATLSTVYAAVMVDADGKIIACDIDEGQIEPTLTDGAVGEVDLRTKTEMGDDYGMVAAGASTMEWYQQVEAFENYVVGKTADEVRAIEMTDGKATDADLSAGCTIAVGGFIEAVASAAENATVSVGASDKLGMAITTEDSTDAEGAAYDSDFCVVTVDADGKVTSCQIDTVQGSLPIVDGAFDTESGSYATKKQLGDDYGMVASGATTMEWYQQAEAFENYVTGKTGEEVSAIELTDGKAADADLAAGCTISISSILSNTEKAIAAAK